MILLESPTSASMRIGSISICIPLSLHSACGGRGPRVPATPGEGFVFRASLRVWHTGDVVNSVFVA